MFIEAINGASNEELPVIFVFQDNGYGISVPKADQTANRKVANNFIGFKNLRIIHCNGKDVFDSMNAMVEAREWVLQNQKPCIVQANCACACILIPIPTGMNCTGMTWNSIMLRNMIRLGKYRRLLIRYKRFTEEELPH